jgi:hypothetical protein
MENLDNFTKITSRLKTKSDVLTYLEAIMQIWPFFGKKIHSRKVPNGLDKKGDVLKKNVIWDFFSELNVESTKNINLQILDPGWHFCFFFACLIWNDPHESLIQQISGLQDKCTVYYSSADTNKKNLSYNGKTLALFGIRTRDLWVPATNWTI